VLISELKNLHYLKARCLPSGEGAIYIGKGQSRKMFVAPRPQGARQEANPQIPGRPGPLVLMPVRDSPPMKAHFPRRHPFGAVSSPGNLRRQR
jgi:hypothetical protein